MPPVHRPPHDPSESRRHLAGIGLIVGAVLLFSCIDASAKWLNRSLPSLQTVGVRYLGSFVLVGLFLNPWSRPALLQTLHWRRQVARALCLVTATVSAFIALRFLPLAQLTSINFAAPLIVALLAGPMLGERIGPRRLVAVLIGLAGVLLVTRPLGGAVHPAVLLVVVAAGANALYSILTRKIAAHDPPETTMFLTGLIGAVVVSPALPFVWVPPSSWTAWLVIGALSLAGALGHWLLILAHKFAPASVLAPFYYAQLLGAIVIGLVVFGEKPDAWTLAGGGVVIASGLYLLYRERVRQKYPSTDVPG